ncbi:MAG: type II toxin-antitoxin system prevent-host-death family antitoxin [Candidatus Dormibacteraeota bacterium]|nr:type II toxin-antitoxin system prevent-host-death family antitoxin [Candidatus Dormibacteraeota bacterium]
MRVRSGETLEVTDRGRPIARIVPLARAGSGLDELIAAGTVRAPRELGPIPTALELPSRMTSEEAIRILREE